MQVLLDAAAPQQAPLELWGGVECSPVQAGDHWRDQVRETGHHDRLDDLDRIAALGIRTLRYPIQRTGRYEPGQWYAQAAPRRPAPLAEAAASLARTGGFSGLGRNGQGWWRSRDRLHAAARHA